MEGKGISFIILLIIVAFLSLTLAALAGYVFFFGTPKTTAAETTTHKEQTKKPADSELAFKKLYEGKKYFNLKNSDDKKVAVIQVGVELVYYKDPKIKGLKSVDEKLKANDGEIKEIVGTYFQRLTIEDVKNPETKEKVKKDLVKAINTLLLENEKEKKDIIYTINFDEWFYQ